ncbi:ABC transporter permease [Leucobacter denitrificans]|uniref:ABC transporter permease n=1 Tax=Leucobacter denitrificans TaxID=683042 RepID=A0A7G9S225_9MICO|nr:ABC transporter permease [Leucobacter denitrificans]QNN61900.1 ABC transporter permease [Leucobacter denitrificans]
MNASNLNQRLRRGPRLTDLFSKWLGRTVAFVALLFLIAPALAIVVMSFANDARILFPPKEWGFARYIEVFTSGKWGAPTVLSIEIGLWVGVLSLLIALPLVFALKRSTLRGKGVLEGSAIAPLVIPVAAYAVGLYGVFAQLGLLGEKVGVILAHTAYSLPLVVIVLSTSLEQIKPDLELAAMTMGASRMKAWLTITLRLLMPSLLAAFLMGFITSFDEAVLITFLGGVGLVTLPKFIFDSVQYAVDPAITAIATLLMVVTTALMLIATSLRKGKK